EAIKLKFFIVEICDKAVAIEAELSIGDIILNSDIQNIQFREYIEPYLETEYTIECDSYEFQNHEVNLCLDLKKLKDKKWNIGSTNVVNLEANRFWFRKIYHSGILTESQQVELNKLHREEIDNRIYLLRDESLTDTKQSATLQQMRCRRLQNILHEEEIANYD
ncbi:6859_t:CDS:2, partial [Gigaspora rosea]